MTKNNTKKSSTITNSLTGLAGQAYVEAHHGELLQGRFTVRGKYVDALVTLPVSSRGSRATFFPDDNKLEVIVLPPSKAKAKCAALITLAYLGAKIGGTLVLDSSIPMRWGMGSSTADVVASILSVSRALNTPLKESEVASLAVRAEGASDPIMFSGKQCLFAHRDGIVIERLAEDTPEFLVISVICRELFDGLDTLSLPQIQYSHDEIGIFDIAMEKLRCAFKVGDIKAIGELATLSAQINQRYRPKPKFDEILKITSHVKALGVQVAHSGSLLGLLFAKPTQARDFKYIEAAMKELEKLDLHDIYCLGY